MPRKVRRQIGGEWLLPFVVARRPAPKLFDCLGENRFPKVELSLKRGHLPQGNRHSSYIGAIVFVDFTTKSLYIDWLLEQAEPEIQRAKAIDIFGQQHTGETPMVRYQDGSSRYGALDLSSGPVRRFWQRAQG